MMSIDNLIEDVNSRVEEYVNREMDMVYCGREKVGLDMRCGTIYINEDCIAVAKYNQGSLEYYGGFEYVSKEYRYEMGGFVFYLGEDSRVRDHIDQFFDRDSEEAA